LVHQLCPVLLVIDQPCDRGVGAREVLACLNAMDDDIQEVGDEVGVGRGRSMCPSPDIYNNLS